MDLRRDRKHSLKLREMQEAEEYRSCSQLGYSYITQVLSSLGSGCTASCTVATAPSTKSGVQPDPICKYEGWSGHSYFLSVVTFQNRHGDQDNEPRRNLVNSQVIL